MAERKDGDGDRGGGGRGGDGRRGGGGRRENGGRRGGRGRRGGDGRGRGKDGGKDGRNRRPRPGGRAPESGERAARRRSAGPPPAARLAGVQELELTVEKLVAGGDGFGRWEGIPVFVPRSAPGDRLRVRLTERRPDYGRAEIVEILAPGPGRREPPCPYFERCGGCDLQHLEDELQPRLKAEAAAETLLRLGGVELSKPAEVVTGDAWGYRLRTQLHTEPVEAAAAGEGTTADAPESGPGGSETTAGRLPRRPVIPSSPVGPTPAESPEGGTAPKRHAVGYHRRASHELVAVDRCPILVAELEGLLPSLPRILDAAAARGERVPRRLDLAAGEAAAEGAGSRITSAPLLEGLPHGEVRLEIEDRAPADGEPARLVYTWDARAFFQAHRGLVERLVEEVVGETTGETAVDLYSGVGLFTLPLARRYGRVTAVEGDRGAVRFCRNNVRRNRAELGGEVEAVSQAVETWVAELPAGVDRVVVDPPRGGLARPVRDALLARLPARITYVSCHAAALARDLRTLTRAYRPERVTHLDLFPQSGHLETVVELVRWVVEGGGPGDDERES